LNCKTQSTIYNHYLLQHTGQPGTTSDHPKDFNPGDSLVPSLPSAFDWVRLAQRVPVERRFFHFLPQGAGIHTQKRRRAFFALDFSLGYIQNGLYIGFYHIAHHCCPKTD
jgi:hypothetical protein